MEVTRLLSNIIKSNYFYFEKKEAKVIDSDSRLGSFVPLSFARVETNEADDSNVQDANATSEKEEIYLQADFLQEREEVLEEVEQLLENARKQAQQIIEDAKVEAEQIKSNAMEEGKNVGYASGIQQAQAEIENEKASLQQMEEQLQREYQKNMEELEPLFVEYMIKYIEKMTGILVEDKKDVILYLLDHGLKQLEKSEHFIIHISPMDYKFVMEQRDKLLQGLKETADVEFMEDKTMKKNQCVIETRDRILDCSLDVQLGRLQEELRLLTLV